MKVTVSDAVTLEVLGVLKGKTQVLLFRKDPDAALDALGVSRDQSFETWQTREPNAATRTRLAQLSGKALTDALDALKPEDYDTIEHSRVKGNTAKHPTTGNPLLITYTYGEDTSEG